MEQVICPVCSNGLLAPYVGDYQAQYINRQGATCVETVPSVSRLRCQSCGEEILDDAASEQIEEATRKASGLLTASDIRALRLNLRKTQIQMASFLGIGAKTYCRWESGSYVQSVAFDNYLRLVRDIPACVAMLNRIESFGTQEPMQLDEVSDDEFSFLTDQATLREHADNFVNQMMSGRLHVCST